MAHDMTKREPIRRGETYTFAEFMQRSGLGRNSIRVAERKGLVIDTVGQRRYVRGDSWHEYLEQQQSQTESSVECV